MGIIGILVVMLVFGIIIEWLRSLVLKKRHGMTLKEYYERKHRGEDVPDL